jgi:hypothetical protein
MNGGIVYEVGGRKSGGGGATRRRESWGRRRVWAWRRWRGREVRGEPYNLSPRMGWPEEARWQRIWWVTPVWMVTSRRV